MSKPMVTVARKERLSETHEKETLRHKRQAVLIWVTPNNCNCVFCWQKFNCAVRAFSYSFNIKFILTETWVRIIADQSHHSKAVCIKCGPKPSSQLFLSASWYFNGTLIMSTFFVNKPWFVLFFPLQPSVSKFSLVVIKHVLWQHPNVEVFL